MKCSDIQDRLSAYYDGELTANARDEVAQHLAQCPACASALTEFESVTCAMGRLPRPKVPPAIWDSISAELTGFVPDEVREDLNVRRAPSSEPPKRSGAPLQRLAVAASILLLVGSGVWVARFSGHFSSDHDHSEEFVMTMDQYLQTLPNDPERAERFLLKKYDGQTVNADEAIKLVGYRPAVAGGLPKGYSLASTSVLKMPCCTCVKAVCKRQDGSTLVLFEHDDEKTAWFGERPANMAMCGDKECCLVDLDSSIAATWKRGSRSVTAVGVRDVEEVNTLVSWLDKNVETTM